MRIFLRAIIIIGPTLTYDTRRQDKQFIRNIMVVKPMGFSLMMQTPHVPVSRSTDKLMSNGAAPCDFTKHLFRRPAKRSSSAKEDVNDVDASIMLN